MHTDHPSWKFRADAAFVERECLLLEAGDYPDRGVRLTPDDLRAIAANTPCDVPVRVEHLRESPFDGALGAVTRLRVVDGQLRGTLRQRVEAWRFVQSAGARALSVALDTAARRLTEVSFVCRPRVAAAQVFGGGQALFHTGTLFEKEEAAMTGVRQFAEGLMQYVRGALGPDGETAGLAVERAELAVEREAMRAQRAAQQVVEFKRQGRLRATERAEELARALLLQGESSVITFGGESTSLAALFARFLEENGPVVPMGEVVPAESGAGASERLVALARETVRRDGTAFLSAFRQVSAAHPDLARAAREDG